MENTSELLQPIVEGLYKQLAYFIIAYVDMALNTACLVLPQVATPAPGVFRRQRYA